jgi:hypothetical protein
MGRLEFAYRDIQGCQGCRGIPQENSSAGRPWRGAPPLSSCHSISIPISECKQAGGAVVAGGFRWAIQHGFLPFVPDWRYVAWRSLAVARGVLVLIVIYFARTASRL